VSFFSGEILIALLTLAGCASVQRSAVIEPSVPSHRYEIEPGRDAATVTEMRAAPYATSAEIALGKNPTGDAGRLAAQGFVRIGTGHTPGAEADARDDATQQGQRVGAEKILLYPPSATGAASASPVSDEEWLALYFVRFKLPFGATFRDLRAQERTQLADGGSGGVAIGSVIGGTPASRANLVTGDIVLAVDGKAIADRAAFQAMLKANAGRSVKLTIVRNGETAVRVVKLGAMQAGG
jgi:hypothetical protein